MKQINFQGLNVLEKLKLIEDVWEDLLKNESDIPSPDWHGDVLTNRAKNLREGKEEVLNWQKAKEEIQEQISANKNS